MALHREHFTAEELARQEALDRSWAQAQKDLADPAFRAMLEASIERLRSSPPAPVMTSEEFLAATEPSAE